MSSSSGLYCALHKTGAKIISLTFLFSVTHPSVTKHIEMCATKYVGMDGKNNKKKLFATQSNRNLICFFFFQQNILLYPEATTFYCLNSWFYSFSFHFYYFTPTRLNVSFVHKTMKINIYCIFWVEVTIDRNTKLTHHCTEWLRPLP